MVLTDLLNPNYIKRLERLNLSVKKSYLGYRQGSHASPKKGQGLEFADYRQYVSGDDFRQIDWNLFGRTEKLYLKQFREEQELSVLFIIDTSPSMFENDLSNKFIYSLKIALSLAIIAIKKGDTAIFLCENETIKARSLNDLAKVTAKLTDIFSRESRETDNSLEKIIERKIPSFRIPGACYIISDFMFDNFITEKITNLIIKKNYELNIIQVLSKEEITPAESSFDILVDSEDGTILDQGINSKVIEDYKLKLAAHLYNLEYLLKKQGLRYILCSSDKEIEDVIFSNFIAKRILT